MPCLQPKVTVYFKPLVIIQIQCKKNYLIQIYNSLVTLIRFIFYYKKIVAKTFNSFSILLCTSSKVLLLREEKPNTRITFTSMQLHTIKQLFIH